MKELIQKLLTEFRVVLWKNSLNELPKQEERNKIIEPEKVILQKHKHIVS